MTFAQADSLCERIIDFLMSCGRNYTPDRIGELQHVILHALATGHFVIRIKGDGSIRYFACLWYVSEDDLEGVLSNPRVMPEDIVHGEHSYVAEVASGGGDGDAREMIKRLKKKQRGKAYWVKPHREFKVYSIKEL